MFLSFSVGYFLFYILMCHFSLSTPTPFSVHACVSLVNHPLCVKVSVAPSLLVASSVLPLSFHSYVHTYPSPIFPVSCFWFLIPHIISGWCFALPLLLDFSRFVVCTSPAFH